MIVLFTIVVITPLMVMIVAQVYAVRAQDAKSRYVVVAKDGVDVAALVRDHSKRLGIKVTEIWNGGYNGLLQDRAIRSVKADPRVADVMRSEVEDPTDRWIGD